jgi:hypothetical protein
MSRNISRRELLAKSGQGALALAGGLSLEAILSGCAGPELQQRKQVAYPPLKGHKVQPPANGCLIGFGESKAPIEAFRKYKPLVGKDPYLFVLQSIMTTRQMVSESMEVPGVPVVQLGLLYPQCKDIISGKNDSYLKKFAQDSTEYGKQHGGFFMSPMWDLNQVSKVNWPWAGQPTEFKKSWRHIWQIFEDQGANEYATWVPEYLAAKGHPLHGYYPGDQYIDWIGLSIYNREKYGDQSLDDRIREPYNYFRSMYPDKPIMLEELGATNNYKQAIWLQDAYKTIKNLTGIKATICWNVVDYQERDDDTLNEQSFETLKEILKDPYWIMAK